MKNLIITVGAILLGVLIVTTLFLGETDSLKSGATSLIQKSNADIEKLVD